MSRRIAIIATGVLAVAALILIAAYSTSPEYTVLYRDLAPEDASEMTKRLDELKIPYKLTEDGTAIEVPSKDVYQARMDLAARGLPKGGGVGFEIFDKSSFTATEFTQKMNYLRALQGELARTIVELSPVEGARVHLVIPEEELFLEKQNPPTASVVLKLAPGASLTAAQVSGIVHLVAGSVEGLLPEHITVLDVNGNMLWNGSKFADDGLAQLSTGQLEAKAQYERTLEESLESMLVRVLGYNKAVVRVHAELDFDRREETSETYQPVVGESGIPRSQTTYQETSDNGTASGGDVAAGGVPTYQSPVGSGLGSRYSRTESQIEYEVNKTVSHRVQAPGKVTRLSVAVLVDAAAADKIDTITQVVTMAAGIDPRRGDQVVVEAMDFSRESETDSGFVTDGQQAAEAKLGVASVMMKYGVPLSIGLFVLIITIVVIRSLSRPHVVVEPQMAGRRVDEVLQAEGPLEEVAAARGTLDPEEERRRRIRSELEQMAKNNPKDLARILESWMREE